VRADADAKALLERREILIVLSEEPDVIAEITKVDGSLCASFRFCSYRSDFGGPKISEAITARTTSLLFSNNPHGLPVLRTDGTVVIVGMTAAPLVMPRVGASGAEIGRGASCDALCGSGLKTRRTTLEVGGASLDCAALGAGGVQSRWGGTRPPRLAAFLTMLEITAMKTTTAQMMPPMSCMGYFCGGGGGGVSDGAELSMVPPMAPRISVSA
jgi:hypothetical protein